MDATDAFELRKHRVTLCAIVVAGSAIAIAFACPTAASMDATAIEAEIANTQSAQIEDDTGHCAGGDRDCAFSRHRARSALLCRRGRRN